MIFNGLNLSMTRGDTESLTVRAKENGSARAFVEGDVVRFTVKKRPSDTAKSFQKTITQFADGVAIVPIEHIDTANLPTGSYWYDVQLTFKDGMVKTIGPAEFTLTHEVTHE